MYSFVYVLGHAHKSRNLQRPDKALNPLELEVQVIASHPIVAENQTQVLFKSSTHS